MVEKEKKEVKEEKGKFVVGDVPTQTAPMVVDSETKEVYSMEAAIAKALNGIEELKKLL